MKKYLLLTVPALMVVCLIVACSNPEEKKKSFYEKARTLYESDDPVKARLEVKNAIQMDPKYAEAYALLGKVELKEKQFQKAFGAFNKAVTLNPELIDAQVQLGRMFLAAKQTDKALEKAVLVLDKKPDDPRALLLKAAALIRQKQKEEAQSILKQLIGGKTKEADAYLMMAALKSGEKSGAAEALLKQGISSATETDKLQLVLARFYSSQKRFDDAVAVIHQLKEKKSGEEAARLSFLLASLYWDAGEKEKAETEMEAVIREDSSNEKTWAQYARFYLARNKKEKALEIVNKGILRIEKSFRLRFLLSDIHFKDNLTDEAIKVLKKAEALSPNPDDPGVVQARTQLAKIYFNTGKTEAAESMVEAVLKEDAKNVEARFIKGNIELSRKNGAGAVAEFRNIITEKPDFPPGYIRLAQAHLLNKETQLAEDTLKKGVKLMPGSRQLALSLSRFYVFQKEYEAAETVLLSMLEKKPDDLAVISALGDLQTGLKEYEKAQQTYAALIQKAPKSPAGHMKMARLFAGQKKWDQAISWAEKGYAVQGNSPKVFAALVNLYMAGGKAETALERCRERLNKNADEVFTRNLMGQVLAGMKQYADAEKSFKDAIAGQPLWQVPHNNLARLYLAQGKKDEAIRNLEAAIEANPKNAAAYITIGQLNEHSGNTEKAINIYRKGFEEIPDFWVAANNLAFLLSESETDKTELKEALTVAEQALKLKPETPEVLDTLGWIHHKLGQNKQALMYLEKAEKAAPESRITQYHMGMALLENGQKAEALEKLRKSIEGEGAFRGREEAEKTVRVIEGQA